MVWSIVPNSVVTRQPPGLISALAVTSVGPSSPQLSQQSLYLIAQSLVIVRDAGEG